MAPFYNLIWAMYNKILGIIEKDKQAKGAGPRQHDYSFATRAAESLQIYIQSTTTTIHTHTARLCYNESCCCDIENRI